MTAKRKQGDVYKARQCARDLFGASGIAIRYGAKKCIGYFTREPHDGPPPWPVMVIGEGETWDEAIEAARSHANGR